MEELDLHGVRHEEVERLLENFILLNNPPLKVITGNSNYMQTTLESSQKHSQHTIALHGGVFRARIALSDTFRKSQCPNRSI